MLPDVATCRRGVSITPQNTAVLFSVQHPAAHYVKAMGIEEDGTIAPSGKIARIFIHPAW